MSYYLGKVGRAGARLVHSCRELYNDVNAAYLTGAVDVLVVRQRDGTLKSTPFHARFGKLGVLRTGDFKEVELTVNGEAVDLPMIIDESGKAFFTQPKPSQTSVSLSEDSTREAEAEGEEEREEETKGREEMGEAGKGEGEAEGQRKEESGGQETGTQEPKNEATDRAGGREGDGDVRGEGEKERDQGSIDIAQLSVMEHCLEDVMSHDSHVTKATAATGSCDSQCDSHVTTTDQSQPPDVNKEAEPPVFEGTLILTPRRGSEPELDMERRDEYARRFTVLEGLGGGANISDSAHFTSPAQERSEPIPIKSPREVNVHAVYSSLPDEMEIFSDSALDDERHQSSSVQATATALSDTEVEIKDRLSSKLWEWSAGRTRLPEQERERRRAVKTSSLQEQNAHNLPAPVDQPGFWGALTGMLRRRSKRRRFSSVEEGIYLDDIDDERMDPEELSKFFPPAPSSEAVPGAVDQTGSSGLGSSPILSPTHSLNPHQYRHGNDMDKLVSTLEGVTLSLCGGLTQGSISEEAFQNSRVSFADFCSNPEILTDPKLVVRVRGKYYPWQVAAPMIMSAVVYLRPLPDATQSKLQKKYMPKKRQSFWYFWGRRTASDEDDDSLPETVSSSSKPVKSEGGTPVGSLQKWDRDSERGGEGVRGEVGRRGGGAGEQMASSDEEAPITSVARPRQRSLRRKKHILTNTLTSEQLASLPLKPGANEMVFSITTKYQGTTKAQCSVYLWDYHDKVVISDIDGTITRSDVAGQVLPLVGMDWTQNGVVELFNSVVQNGYRVLYLSARAIGQAGYTKEFLRRIRRGHTALPDGPLFLSPSSLVTAFKKEVIEKRPFDFKIECLQQVCSLFPDDYCPLHAGFGNRNSDVKSYTQVGVPRSRIFTVNHKGHLKYEISNTFQSSYLHMMEFVDAQFPPFQLCTSSPLPSSPLLLSPPSSSLPPHPSPPSPRHTREEYNTFNYWRDLVELPLIIDV